MQILTTLPLLDLLPKSIGYFIVVVIMVLYLDALVSLVMCIDYRTEHVATLV